MLTDDTRTLFADGTTPDVPIITGTNADEATLFTAATAVPNESTYESLVRAFAGAQADAVLAAYPSSDFASPKDAYNHLFSDVAFICPALSFAAAASGGTAPSFTYHFTRRIGPLGAFHGLELAFVFGNLTTTSYVPGDTDYRLSASMQTAWTRFAQGHDPRTTPTWPAYDPADPKIAVFDDPMTVASQIRAGRCATLHSLGFVP